MLKLLGVLLLGLIAPLSVSADPAVTPDRVGDVHVIRLSRESHSRFSEGGDQTSNDEDVLVERVLSVGEGGVVLAFDLDVGATDQVRSQQWAFPASVLISPNGALSLQNEPELNSRIDTWLSASHLDRSACGRFTETGEALRIRCDPGAVLRVIRNFDLRSIILQDGASYVDARAREPLTLRREGGRRGTATFTATGPVSSDAVIREFTNVSGAASQRAAAKQPEPGPGTEPPPTYQVTGSVQVTIDTDVLGLAVRRVRVERFMITRNDGFVEHRTSTATTERTLRAP